MEYLLSFLFEFFFQILGEFVFGSVGALILWAKNGCKDSVKTVFAENQNVSMFIGLIFWVFVVAIFLLIF